MIWQQAWVWGAGGLVLAALEMMAPGFYLLGLAAGALLVGLLLWLGVLGGSLPVMLVVAAVGALVTWLALRQIVGVQPGQARRWDKDINEN
jgi:membrane protein implicated in regulation of membrane protease activity